MNEKDEKANENGEKDEEENDKDEEEKEQDEEENEEVKEKKKVTPKKPLPNFKGKGKHLTDIGLIDANITNTKADSLSVLHNLIYEDPGNIKFVKKNLRKFNGFDFDNKSEEYTRRLEAAKKVELSKLSLIADVLNLNDKGTVDELSERILTFLLKPEGSKSGALEANDDAEDSENSEQGEEEEEEEEDPKPAKKASNRRLESKKTSSRTSSGRPKRATAGRNTTKDNFSYVDYDSDEEEAEAPAPRKRGKHGSDSGSDVRLFS